MVQFLINEKKKKSLIYNNIKNIKRFKFTRTRIIYILFITLIILLYFNLKYKPYYYDDSYQSNVKFIKDKVILLWTDQQRTHWNINSNGITQKVSYIRIIFISSDLLVLLYLSFLSD